MAEGPEAQLVEKLRRIEALFARAGSEGERVAAERAQPAPQLPPQDHQASLL